MGILNQKKKLLITSKNIINKNFACYKVPYELDVFDNEEYKKSNTKFYATVTNVETGKPEYILVKDVFEQMEVLRATSAMPFVSEIVEIDGKKYLDGGISDSIPYEKCKELGVDKIIVVLTRDINYRKKPNKLISVIKLKYRKYPKFVSVMEKRHSIYNKTLKRIQKLENEGKIFVIRPKAEVKIGRLEKDTQKMTDLYNAGYNEAKDCFESLIKYLNS